MEKKSQHYDAFISYRHLPLDSYVATTLHRTLESFSLPKHLIKEGQKFKLDRVFRDRDELPLSNNLSKPIDEALSNSDYLVVICTPELQKSQWCLREIDNFKKLHGQNRIFAVLAQGEPKDSFPAQILTEEYETTDENGNTIIKTRNVEPLAADVRGKNRFQIKKKIREESLRLVAPIFGVTYDALKQRHREQKLKRIAALSSAAALILLIFGVICASMAITINSQSKQIKNDYAKSLASEAMTALSQGNKSEALNLANRSLTASDNAEAKYVLNNAEAKYAPEGIMVNSYSVDLKSGINSMFISPDKSRIIVNDNLGRLTLIDSENGDSSTLLDEFKSYCNSDNAVFLDNDRFLYNGENRLNIIDLNTGETQTISAEPCGLFFVDKNNTLYTLGYGKITAYNSKNMSQLYSFDADCSLSSKAATTTDGSRLFVSSDTEDPLDFSYTISDAGTGELLASGKKLGGFVSEIIADKDSFYVSTTTVSEGKKNTSTKLVKIDANTGEKLWESDSVPVMVLKSALVNKAEKCYLFTLFPTGPATYNPDTGEQMFTANIPDCMISAEIFAESGLINLISINGSLLTYDISTGICDFANNYFIDPVLKVDSALLTDDSAYIFFQGTDYLSAYKKVNNQNRTHLGSIDINPASALKGYVPFEYSIFEYYGYGDKITLPSSESQSVAVRSPDDEYCMCYDETRDGIRIYSAKSSSIIGELNINPGFVGNVFFSADSRYACATKQNGDLVIKDLFTDSETITLNSDYLSIKLMTPLSGDYYAIVSSAATTVVNKGFDRILTIDTTEKYECMGYDSADNSFVVRTDEDLYKIPFEE